MSTTPDPAKQGPWWKLLNRYHWFVLLVAGLGWLFDCLDQQLFLLARAPALTELLGGESAASTELVTKYGGYATTIFMFGWATGGLVFGVLGDRIGRARTMIITILMYSLFTGLSSISTGFWDFAAYRFLTGLGVGGEFAVGVALVAESLPARTRSYALGLLQAVAAWGNISAAFINIWIGRLESSGAIGGSDGWSAWRWMFIIGAVPALLALVIRWRLKEPETWVKAKQSGEHNRKEFGSYGMLFRSTLWRRNAIIGVTLACSGVFALWGIVFYSFELVRTAFGPALETRGLSPAQIEGTLKGLVGKASFWLNIGAFLGTIGFSYLTQWTNRRIAFALTYLGGMASTVMVFWFMRDPEQVPWMMMVMGIFVFGLFAGYAIYLPELFPTPLRSTGTSFCYNVGRYVGAFAPTLFGLLTSEVFVESNGFKEGIRYAGISMSIVFVVGLSILPFAPETKDKPLPESEEDFFNKPLGKSKLAS